MYRMQLFLKPVGAGILDSALLENLGQYLAYSCTIPASFSIITGHQGYACLPIAVLSQGLGTPLTLTHHHSCISPISNKGHI